MPRLLQLSRKIRLDVNCSSGSYIFREQNRCNGDAINETTACNKKQPRKNRFDAQLIYFSIHLNVSIQKTLFIACNMNCMTHNEIILIQLLQLYIYDLLYMREKERITRSYK